MTVVGRSRPASAATTAAVVGAVLAAVFAASCSTRSHRAPSSSPTASSAVPTTFVATSTTTTPRAGLPASGDEWLTYQNGNDRLGVAGPQPSLGPLRLAWTNHLDGYAVYGQPVVASGKVIVGTEGDDVAAVDPTTGRTLWEDRIGTPLRGVSAAAGCGDVDPLGITSTPVIDPVAGVVYVVGEISTDGTTPVHHQLVGLDVATGSVVESVDADPPLPAGENPVNLLQRSALALAAGRVYVSYGGQFGDCGRYHGWVVGVPAHGHASLGGTVAFDTTPQSTGGAIWQGGGGPSVDTQGDVYVTTGNPNSGATAPWSNAVLKLRSDLASRPEAAFQDAAAVDDQDLGTGTAVLLPDGDVFAVGKTDVGFLLRESDLSRVEGIRGEICGSDPDGGPAFVASLDSVYVPCRGGGLQQVDLRDGATGWRAGSVNSTPIYAAGRLFALAYPGGLLDEIDPATGAVTQQLRVGETVPNFAAPSAALGRLFVGTDSGLAAISGP
jgi:polyvinyl alcohol dehydrogenase (cytochrome)